MGLNDFGRVQQHSKVLEANGFLIFILSDLNKTWQKHSIKI